MCLWMSENRRRWKDPLGTMLDSIKTLPMQKVPAGEMTFQKPVPRDAAACPFCGQILEVRANDGYALMPLVSKKKAPIRSKCRSRDCKGRWVDVDIQGVQE